MTVFKQLRAACLPHMTHFKADLVMHDRRTLRKHDGTPFLHWTRKLGTEILMLITADEYPPIGTTVPFIFGRADRDHLLNEAVKSARCWTEPCNGTVEAVHHFDGKTLRQIDVAKACVYALKCRASVSPTAIDMCGVHEEFIAGDGSALKMSAL